MKSITETVPLANLYQPIKQKYQNAVLIEFIASNFLKSVAFNDVTKSVEIVGKTHKDALAAKEVLLMNFRA